jgi:hypothetical protein
VAHFSPAKAIIGVTFYLVAGIGLALLLAYRIPLPFFFNERFAQAIVGIGILFCAVMVIGRLQIILPGGCFFRAGRDGIWYKQVGTLDATPGRPKETRMSWHEVTRWYPHILRMNGMPLWKVIVFETTNGKHPVQIHLYKESQDQIIANIKTASR